MIKEVEKSAFFNVIIIYLERQSNTRAANTKSVGNFLNLSDGKFKKILEPFVFLTQLRLYFKKLRKMAKTSII
jgi:hypothetical protein